MDLLCFLLEELVSQWTSIMILGSGVGGVIEAEIQPQILRSLLQALPTCACNVHALPYRVLTPREENQHSTPKFWRTDLAQFRVP